MTMMFLVMEGVIGYYLYQSRRNFYAKSVEVAMVYLVGITLLVGVVFSVLEHVGSWKEELSTVIEPCLVYLRLRGVRKVHDVVPNHNKKRENIKTVSEIPSENVSKVDTEEYDAFYMRMIKKEKVNRKYRK